MKKARIILVVLSAIYIVLTIVFLLNDESLFNNFNLLNLIDYLQGWLVVGLVLLTAVIIAGTLYIRSLKKRYNKLEKEHNLVKSRVYEIEEERKAEVTRQQQEEEETERKLEAFNASLKGRKGPDAGKPDPDRSDLNRQGYDRPGPDRPDFEDADFDEPGTRPSGGQIDLGRLDDNPNVVRPLPPGRPPGGSSPEGDRPSQP